MAKAYVPGTKLSADNSEEVFVQPSYIAPAQKPKPQQAKFLDAFKTTSQSTNQTAIYDSYNRTESTVNNTSDSGNTSLSLGASGGGGGVAEYAPLLFGAFALLGGLYLITR